jgi:hypothetical protein
LIPSYGLPNRLALHAHRLTGPEQGIRMRATIRR